MGYIVFWEFYLQFISESPKFDLRILIYQQINVKDLSIYLSYQCSVIIIIVYFSLIILLITTWCHILLSLRLINSLITSTTIILSWGLGLFRLKIRCTRWLMWQILGRENLICKLLLLLVCKFKIYFRDRA